MKSGIHNIEIESGSQFDMLLTITNADDSDYSLSGYSPDMQVRDKDSTILIDCSSYISVQNGNELKVSIPASASVSIGDETAFYQIEIVDGTTEYSLLRGNAKFIKAVII